MAGPTEYILSLVVRAKDEASSIFGGITAKVTGLFAALGAFIGITTFADSVKDAAEFEKAMDRVAAKVDDLSENNFANLKAAAEEASKATGRSAVEAAEGLEILAGAGYKTEEAIATLPVVLKTATLESISLEEAALAVADSMTVMGIAKMDAAKAGDILAKGANLEATTVTELAESLREGGSAAKSFGFDLADTVSILDVFAKNGLRSSEAGTALNAILRELSNPASKARQELAALGDTSGTLEGAINTLANAGDRGKLAILAFGDEAGPGLRALINEGTTGLAEYEQKLRDSTGAMESAANTISGNLINAWDRFLAVLDSVKRFLVEPLLQPFTDEINQLTKDLDEASKSPAFAQFQTTIKQVFSEAVTAVREFITNLNFKDAMQAVQDFAADVSKNMDTVKTTFSVIKDVASISIQGVASSVDIARVAFNQLTGDTEGVDAAFNSLASRGDSIKASFDNISVAIDPVNSKLQEQSIISESAANKTTQLSESQESAAMTADALAKSQAESGNAAEESAIQVEDASVKIVDAKEAEREANNKVQEQVAKLREEYSKMLDAGDTTGAVNALKEIDNLLGKTSETAKKTSEAVVSAFASLGLKSQEELNTLTKNAENNFLTIKNSGEASAADIKAAWIAYAETAIKNSENLSESEKHALDIKLEMQAAIYGAKDAYDSISGSLEKAIDATNDLADAEKDAADAAGQVETSLYEQELAARNATVGVEDLTGALKGVSVAAIEVGDKLVTAFGERNIQIYEDAVRRVNDWLERARVSLEALASDAGPRAVKQAELLANSSLDVSGYMDETVASVRDELIQAIASANDEMQAFVETEQRALKERQQELEDYKAQGDALREEELRHEREMMDLEEQRAKANSELSGQAQKDALAAIDAQVAAENELHRLKMQNIEQEQAAREQAAQTDIESSSTIQLEQSLKSISSISFETTNRSLDEMFTLLVQIESQALKTEQSLRKIDEAL